MKRHEYKKVIDAVLVSHDLKAAAVLAGVSEPTIYRWIKNPDFRDKLNAARARAYADVIAALWRDSEAARQELRELLKDESPKIRLQAANSILEKANAGAPFVGLMERFAKVEKLVNRPGDEPGPGADSAPPRSAGS